MERTKRNFWVKVNFFALLCFFICSLKSISFLETSIRFSFFMEQTIELFLLLMMYLSPFFSIVVRMTQKTILKHLLSLPSSFLGRFSAKNSSSHSIGK